MKQVFSVNIIWGILLFCTSCDRVENIKINDQYLYRFTDAYFPTIEDLEPPHLLEIKGGGFVCSEIYRVQWNDRTLIATQYPDKNTIHNYFIILPKDSVLTGHDVKLGPLTRRQRDSVISVHRIDTAGMQVIDFN